MLTQNLLPLMKAAGEPGDAARIVIVSGAAMSGKIYFDDVNLTSKFGLLRVVGQTCQANDVFTLEQARHLPGVHRSSVTITCLKMGVVKTNIRNGRDFPWWMKVLVPLVMDPLPGQTAEEASASVLQLLLAADYEGVTGALFLKIKDLKPIIPNASVAEEQIGKRLWELSERLSAGAASNIRNRFPRRDTEPPKGKKMTKFWKFAPWLIRLMLLTPTVIFAMIASRYLFDPVRTGTAIGLAFNTPVPLTVTRVAFGAFPLAISIFTLSCLVSIRRILTGLGFVALIMALALVVRVFGMLADGSAHESKVWDSCARKR